MTVLSSWYRTWILVIVTAIALGIIKNNFNPEQNPVILRAAGLAIFVTLLANLPFIPSPSLRPFYGDAGPQSAARAPVPIPPNLLFGASLSKEFAYSLKRCRKAKLTLN